TLDAFRLQWQDISLDLSAAFSFAPIPALMRGDLDLVITSDPIPNESIDYVPLFKYELVLAVAADNPLSRKRFIKPADLSNQVLITYPVEEERLDIFTAFLDPAGVEPASIRTAELTPMIVQRVSSSRGVAALPNWALTEYQAQDWLKIVHLGEAPGIWRTLHAAIRTEEVQTPWVQAVCQQALEWPFKPPAVNPLT